MTKPPELPYSTAIAMEQKLVSLPVDITPAQVRTGMTIRIHQTIKDVNAQGDEKERVQVFEGLVTSVGGAGVSKTMTVRKVSEGIGVERIYPLTLPAIQRIECVKVAKVRRKNIAFIAKTKKRLREMKQVKLAA